MFAIRSDQDFASTLVELRARHLVLIDTVGMSQRDQRVSEQIAMLAGGGKPVQRLLLLSAVSQANVLEDVVKAYSARQLSGCILTKTAETLTLGGALDVLMRHRLAAQHRARCGSAGWLAWGPQAWISLSPKGVRACGWYVRGQRCERCRAPRRNMQATWHNFFIHCIRAQA